MNCRQCGIKIPSELLKSDSFRCPECGKMYRRKSAQPVVASTIQQPVAKTKRKKEMGFGERLKKLMTQKTLKLPVWFCLLAALCLLAPVFGLTGSENANQDINTQPVSAVPVHTAVVETVLPIFEASAVPVQEKEVPTVEPTVQPTPEPTAEPTIVLTQIATEEPRVTAVPLSQQQIKPGDTGERVIALQKRLIELGFLSGKVDGSYGKNTQAAVAAYQKAAGLNQTGICDYQTYQSMTSSSAPRIKSSSKSSSGSSDSSGGSVWIAPDSGKKYHSNKDCRGLRNANSVKQISKSSAIKNYEPCGICY